MSTTFTVPFETEIQDDCAAWLSEHGLDCTKDEFRLEVTIEDDGSVHLLRDLIGEDGLPVLTGDGTDIASEPVVIAHPKRPFPWPR